MFEICLGSWEMPRVFAEAYIYFIVSASAKKNAEAIEFLGILKELFQEKKYTHFCFLKKEMSCLIKKKKYFHFLHDFQIIMMQIIYCIIHRCLFSVFILLLFY